jgi:hypothetical protein
MFALPVHALYQSIAFQIQMITVGAKTPTMGFAPGCE